MVWGQPNLGLGIKEGKEIEAGWSDANFLCDVDANFLCSEGVLAENDPGVTTTRSRPVQKHFQASSGGLSHGLSSIPIWSAGLTDGPSLPQRHAPVC